MSLRFFSGVDMKTFFVLIFSLFSFACFAEGLIIYAPEHIAEYENFRFQVAPEKKFSVTVSNECLTVQRLSGIEKVGNLYVSGKGKAIIYFDNKCFENTEVTISVGPDKKGTRRYTIEHRIPEPQDMGC